jgi:hypothetical protein
VYQKLVDWARAVKEAGKVLPLDAELERHRFNRWGESR